jgi:hypothetical protein
MMPSLTDMKEQENSAGSDRFLRTDHLEDEERIEGARRMYVLA